MLNKFWNYKIIGFPSFMFIVTITLHIKFYEFIKSLMVKINLGSCGRNFKIQKGSSVRYPGNINFGSNISIGRNCNLISEFSDSTLHIKNNTQINRNCVIDFSGNLSIGSNVVISEGVNIMTHSHGLNPHSIPSKQPLLIEDNVWIGAHSIILPKVTKISMNSIIAAGSVVTKNVPEKVIYGGNPARIIRNIS